MGTHDASWRLQGFSIMFMHIWQIECQSKHVFPHTMNNFTGLINCRSTTCHSHSCIRWPLLDPTLLSSPGFANQWSPWLIWRKKSPTWKKKSAPPRSYKNTEDLTKCNEGLWPSQETKMELGYWITKFTCLGLTGTGARNQTSYTGIWVPVHFFTFIHGS